MKLLWDNSGKPQHKFTEESVQGFCACCGAPIQYGAPVSEIVTDTFARQSDFMAHGTHICGSCAWMCTNVKVTHRNVIAAGTEVWWPMIGHDSATDDRPSWYDVLRIVANMPAETPVIGVITTDPKPRLWPMAQQRTVSDFGLYVHCPDYDFSEFVIFDIQECLEIADIITPLMAEGFSKRSCYFSVLSDMKKVKKNPLEFLKKEVQLKELRKSPAFIAALLIAGEKKEDDSAKIRIQCPIGGHDAGATQEILTCEHGREVQEALF
jgi:hypothetical protein